MSQVTEYSEKVMDHFTNPRNVGEIENASGVGTVGNAKCGDIMRIYFDIDENKVIQDVKFKTGKIDHKFQLSVDVQNVGNLINSHWGVHQTNASCKNGAVLHYAGMTDGNVPTFTMNEFDGKLIKDSYTTLKSDANVWRLQLGLKYFFN